MDSNTTNIALDIFIVPTEDIHKKIKHGSEKFAKFHQTWMSY